MKLTICFILLFLLTSFIYPQSAPTYKKRAGKVISMSNMVGVSSLLTCEGDEIQVGTIVKRIYMEDEYTISGFVLQAAKADRKTIYIDHGHLEVWGRKTHIMVSGILALKSKVRVTVTTCRGDSGVFLFAKQITK